MTAAAETAVFVLDLDARSAEAGLGRMRQQVAGTADVLNKGAGGVKFFQERVEKTATAVTGMSSVLGGLGSQAGATFGAMSNLASAFVVGGPLLAGIAGATTLAAALYNRYMEAEEAAARLAETQRRQTAEALDLVKQRADSAAEALRNFGKTQTQIALDENRRLQGRAQGAITGGTNAERAMRAAMRAAGIREDMDPQQAYNLLTGSDVVAAQYGVAGQVFTALFESSQQAAAQMSVASQQLGVLKREEADLLALLQKQNEARRQGSVARGSRGGLGGLREGQEMALDIADTPAFREAYDLAVSAAEAHAAERARFGEDLAQAFAEHDLEITRETERQKTEIAKDAIREENAFRRSMAADAAAFGQQMIMQTVDLGLAALEAGVKGQMSDIGLLVASFVRGMGQQIMGIGLKYVFEGLGMIAVSKGTDPAGYATLAVGGAAFAAGGAMAATGTVLGALPGRGGGGGGGRGGRVGTVGSRGGGGTTNAGGSESVTIVFNGGTHIGDSTEQARTFARNQRRATRNVWVPGGP